MGEIVQGKRYFQKHFTDMAISPDVTEVDCHYFSHGAAVLRIMVHIDLHPSQDHICVITGQGLDDKKPYAMKDYVIMAMEKYCPEFDIIKTSNDGRIIINPFKTSVYK